MADNNFYFSWTSRQYCSYYKGRYCFLKWDETWSWHWIAP